MSTGRSRNGHSGRMSSAHGQEGVMLHGWAGLRGVPPGQRSDMSILR